MHSARVVGMPSACIASEHKNSRMLDRSTARPSPTARIGRAPGAFQLHLPALAGSVLDFAQQDRPAIPQLGHEMAKLMTGIQRGNCIHAGQQLVARQCLDHLGGG